MSKPKRMTDRPWDMPLPKPPPGGWNWPNTWPAPPPWMSAGPPPLVGRVPPPVWPPPPRIPFGGLFAHPGTHGDVFVGAKNAPLTGGWVYGLHNWMSGPWNAGPRQNPYDQSGNVGRA